MGRGVERQQQLGEPQLQFRQQQQQMGRRSHGLLLAVPHLQLKVPHLQLKVPHLLLLFPHLVLPSPLRPSSCLEPRRHRGCRS